MIRLICIQLSCFSTHRLSNCLYKLQDTFTYCSYLIRMLNHGNCAYNLSVHPSFAHTRLPKSAQIKTTDYVRLESITNTLMYWNWHRVPGGMLPSALGLVSNNKTCDATSLGELSRDSQSNNFLSIYAPLTVLEITASVQKDDQTGPLIPCCFAQPGVLLETRIPVKVSKWW